MERSALLALHEYSLDRVSLTDMNPYSQTFGDQNWQKGVCRDSFLMFFFTTQVLELVYLQCLVKSLGCNVNLWIVNFL